MAPPPYLARVELVHDTAAEDMLHVGHPAGGAQPTLRTREHLVADNRAVIGSRKCSYAVFHAEKKNMIQYTNKILEKVCYLYS